MSTRTGRRSTSHTILQLPDAAVSADVPYPLAKRAFDRGVGAVLAVVLSPVFLVAVVLIGLDQLLVPGDRGRWLYRERRISRGREFDVLKFRVLREDVLAEIAAGAGKYARLYEADQVNLTRSGRIIKRIYADELPQVFNILRGDISLVGPRPWPVSMVEEQVAKGVDYRLRVMAGWTGPAQVRKDTGAKSAATELDLEYIDLCRTLSGPQLVRHDIGVLRQSLRTVARARGLQF
jgi:lipopolysaccharide/colanic/teichoic acid biosynthesis glycosyltransferase